MESFDPLRRSVESTLQHARDSTPGVADFVAVQTNNDREPRVCNGVAYLEMGCLRINELSKDRFEVACRLKYRSMDTRLAWTWQQTTSANKIVNDKVQFAATICQAIRGSLYTGTVSSL